MKKTTLFPLITSLFTTFALADSSLLTEEKQDYLKKKRLEANRLGDALEKSWVSPIYLEAGITRVKQYNVHTGTRTLSLSISQDIFRSGGIPSGIKSAKNTRKISLQSLDKSEREMIFSIYESVLNLQKIDLLIDQQTLLIENKKIEIKTKQEYYVNGIIDILEVDSAMIELNTLKNAVEELKEQSFTLKSTLSNLTPLAYKKIEVPTFPLIDEETYLAHNSTLTLQKTKIEGYKIDSELMDAKHLPKITLIGNYTHDQENEDNSYTYGLNFSMPLYFNRKSEIESSRLTYLASKSELNDLKVTEKNIYHLTKHQLNKLTNIIKNTDESLKSYENILSLTLDQYNHKLKTKEDVTVIKNRIASMRLDIDSYKIEKKLIRLSLLKRVFE